jgi:hydrogenase nickel incorporation protein HypA/HybF
MHEMWLCKSILEIVCRHAEGRPCRRVKKITLEIGELTTIDISVLLFNLKLAAQTTLADQAEIDIIRPPGEEFRVKSMEVE